MVLQKTPVCIFIELARILRILHSKLAETPLFAGKERDEKAARSLSEGILKKKSDCNKLLCINVFSPLAFFAVHGWSLFSTPKR